MVGPLHWSAVRWALAAAACLLLASPMTGETQGDLRPPDGPFVELTCGTGPDAAPLDAGLVADGQPLWAEQSPGVLTPDYSGPIRVTIAYSGDVGAIRVFYSAPSGGYVFDEFARVESRVVAGTSVSLFRPEWPARDFILRFGSMVDHSNGLFAGLIMAPATVPLGAGGLPTTFGSLGLRGMSAGIRDVPVVQVNAAAQYSSHVLNLVLPGFNATLGPAESFDTVAAARQVYAYLGDDYESLAFVFAEAPFRGTIAAYHEVVKNDIQGIGLRLVDTSVSHGSAGRLLGIDVFLTAFGTQISNHELSHQWGHYFDWPAVTGIPTRDLAHTPLWGVHESPVSNAIAASLRLAPAASPDRWTVERAPEPTRVPPLQAYAMGRLAAADVPPIFVLDDQSRTIDLGPLTATTREVPIAQLVAHHGPRLGPVVSSLRRATVLVSRDRLATAREMAYWTYRAQRLEDPDQTGMIDAHGVGSFEAVTGVPLRTGLVLSTPLPGHAAVEPAALDVRDLPGMTLDAGMPLTQPTSGLVRLSGRIDDPVWRAAVTEVAATFATRGVITLTAPVAPDGSFTILGPSEVTQPARNTLRLWLRAGGQLRSVASVPNVRFVSSPGSVPATPVGVRATVSGRSVSVQWSPDTGATPDSYVLEVGSAPGLADLGSFPTASPALAASGVGDGRYYVRARARNSAGFSVASAEATIDVGCLAPLAPASLTSTVAGSVVSLAWQPSASAGAAHWIVAGSAPGLSDIAQLPVAGSALQAAVPTGRYFIRIRAISSCGVFVESNEVEARVGLPPLPGAPPGFTATAAGSTVTMTWQPASGTVTGYVIEAGSQSGLANLARLAIGNVLTLTVPGVPSGTYFVRVRAAATVGEGPPSNEVTLVVQ